MRWMAILGLLACAVLVQGCSESKPDACYGISDAEAYQMVARANASAAARSGPAENLSKDRLLGVGRSGGPRGSGDDVIQLWFRQDDGTVIDASVYQDCEIKYSIGRSEDLKNAAYPVKPAKF
jgi:hypothetical protein